jgi:AAA+ superfamily predicted ATPase
MIGPSEELFERVITFPDPGAQRRFAELIGLDEIKEHLLKHAGLLLAPELLQEWSTKHYREILPIVSAFQSQPPMFIFAGDVGTGKTALAETFGDAIARQDNVPITLFRLSLSARGSGAVGEMTRLISAAFSTIEDNARAAANPGGSRGAVILLIDEADALVQSRALSQMHHEDRAGVNAIIRGVDRLATEKLPAVVVMCTNRPGALDPAVVRRAAAIFNFGRPNLEQRAALLQARLEGLGLTKEQLDTLAHETGEKGDRPYGFTYSDITQRLLPNAILRACPHDPLTFEIIFSTARDTLPTAPFGDDSP